MRSSQSRPAAPSPLWALYQCLTWYWILNLEITVLQDGGGIVNARYQKNFRISFPFLLFYLSLFCSRSFRAWNLNVPQPVLFWRPIPTYYSEFLFFSLKNVIVSLVPVSTLPCPIRDKYPDHVITLDQSEARVHPPSLHV